MAYLFPQGCEDRSNKASLSLMMDPLVNRGSLTSSSIPAIFMSLNDYWAPSDL